MKFIKEKINIIKIIVLIIAPILWPFLNFINSNIGEYYSPTKLIFLMFFVILFFLIVFMITKIVFFKKFTSLRFATFFSTSIILFFSYSLTSYLATTFLKNNHNLKVWILITSITLTISFVLSRKFWFQNFLTLTCVSLVSFPILQLIYKNIQSMTYDTYFKNQSQYKKETVKFKKRLNVYYVVPDMYSNKKILKELFNFDNSNFINELKKRKFIISKDPMSNYSSTVYSMSSIFAKEYLFTTKKLTPISSINDHVYNSKSPTHETFKKNGYKIATLRFNGANCNKKFIDYCLDHKDLFFSDLEVNLLRITPLPQIYHFIFKKNLNPNYFEMSDFMSFIKNTEFQKPTFTYIHILLPHEPFRFREDCTKFSLNPFKEFSPIKGYVDHTKCINKGILELFDYVVENDPNSIFILQSDHGQVVKEKLWPETYSIINAWYIPQNLKCSKEKFQNFTSVNTFKILENCLSNNKQNLLKNRWFRPKNWTRKFSNEFVELFKN